MMPFGYLSARYQITTIAPQGMSTESEASASDVAKIIQQIRKEKIKALFVENISDPRLMQQISKETDVAPGKGCSRMLCPTRVAGLYLSGYDALQYRSNSFCLKQ